MNIKKLLLLHNFRTLFITISDRKITDYMLIEFLYSTLNIKFPLFINLKTLPSFTRDTIDMINLPGLLRCRRFVNHHEGGFDSSMDY